MKKYKTPIPEKTIKVRDILEFNFERNVFFIIIPICFFDEFQYSCYSTNQLNLNYAFIPEEEWPRLTKKTRKR